MNIHNPVLALITMLGLIMATSCFAQAQKAPAAPTKTQVAKNSQEPAPVPSPTALQPCTSVTVDKPTQVVLGKSTVVKLTTPAVRMVVGGLGSGRAGQPTDVATPDRNATAAPAAALNEGVGDVDLMLLSPTELFFLGKRAGSMNVVLQGADGSCSVKDLVVTVDPDTLQAKLGELMPEESDVKVRGAENSIVLTGAVSDAIKLNNILNIAASYGNGKKVVNLMRVTSPQQVMLEVTIAEVSKTLLDQLGSAASIRRGGDTTYSLISNFLVGGGGLVQALKIGKTLLQLDGQKDDGVVRVLAEPNIMAISGQQASFLSGGRIFIPVSQASGVSLSPTITLEEKEFGIGVKFTPTVLGGGRVNLKMVSEVSDLSQTGSPFTTVNGVTSVFPSMTVRRADTTVELNDGQSFVIAGLIDSGSTDAVKRFPGLGEVPILGALFRSTEFQTKQSELVFVITPRLVQPLAEVPRLPTDNYVAPTRGEVYTNGALENSTPAPAPQTTSTPREGFAPAPAVSSPTK